MEMIFYGYLIFLARRISVKKDKDLQQESYHFIQFVVFIPGKPV